MCSIDDTLNISKPMQFTHIQFLVGVKNESDYHIGHHVDEEGNINVEVNLTEDPDKFRFMRCPIVGIKYVISTG